MEEQIKQQKLLKESCVCSKCEKNEQVAAPAAGGLLIPVQRTQWENAKGRKESDSLNRMPQWNVNNPLVYYIWSSVTFRFRRAEQKEIDWRWGEHSCHLHSGVCSGWLTVRAHRWTLISRTHTDHVISDKHLNTLKLRFPVQPDMHWWWQHQQLESQSTFLFTGIKYDLMYAPVSTVG